MAINRTLKPCALWSGKKQEKKGGKTVSRKLLNPGRSKREGKRKAEPLQCSAKEDKITIEPKAVHGEVYAKKGRM